MARILVIEDDPDIRSAIALALDGEGYENLVAGSVRSALDLVHETEIDLVILDLHLPGKDGIEILNEGQLTLQLTPPSVLAISGGGPTFTASVGLTAARAMGVDATLYKPFSTDELISTVSYLLKRRDHTI